MTYVRLGKILEIIGLMLIAGTIYSFLGMTESELRWPVFWTCAAGALMHNNLQKLYEKKTKKITNY